jgi:hypothetical protein
LSNARSTASITYSNLEAIFSGIVPIVRSIIARCSLL